MIKEINAALHFIAYADKNGIPFEAIRGKVLSCKNGIYTMLDGTKTRNPLGPGGLKAVKKAVTPTITQGSKPDERSLGWTQLDWE